MAVFSGLTLLTCLALSHVVSVTDAVCAFNPCQNGGQCSDDSGQMRCNCPAEYTGVLCESLAPITTTTTPVPTTAFTDCPFNPCLNGGLCVLRNNGYVCICPPSHAGVVCEEDFTTPVTTTTVVDTTMMPSVDPSNTCPDASNFSLGCDPADIVFLVEYASSDSKQDLDHEGDAIKNLIDRIPVDDDNTRIGMVVYHNRVHDVVHFDDYSSATELKGRINYWTHILTPSGDANLTLALDYTRETAFVGARPGVQKVVIPIVHQMQTQEITEMLAAGQRLKDDCAIIAVDGVQSDTLDPAVLGQLASPGAYFEYPDFKTYEERHETFPLPQCN